MMKQFFIALVGLIAGVMLQAADGSKFTFLRLEDIANRGFHDETAGDGKGGWFDQGPVNDMAIFPVGIGEFGGVPFRIIDPAANNGKSCVILRGRNLTALPLDTGAIAVGQKGGAIFLLTSCGWNTKIGDTVLTVTVRFRRPGLYLEFPLRYRVETGPWWGPEAPECGKVGWQGNNRSAEVGVYLSGWINPYPGEEIESVTVASQNSGVIPAILGITLANDSQLIAEWQKLSRRNEPSATIDNTPARLTLSTGAPVRCAGDGIASLALGFNQNVEFQKAAAHLVAAGKQKPFLRLQINIAEPSPAEGVWDFSKLDRYLDFIQATGAEPMLCFGPGGPIWMADPNVPGTMQANWRPRNREEYAAYCETIFKRYTVERKNPVRWWQIGNETELKGWSYRYYADWYAELAPRLRKISPDVLLGGPVTCNPNLGWARELLRESASQVDFLSYHQYGYAEPFDTPASYVMSRTSLYRDSAAAYRQLGKEFNRELPIIVSEANTNPRYANPPGTDPRIRTNFCAAWYLSALCRFAQGGGDALCFFTLDGGFGACQLEKGKLALYPVYHALWLFRRAAGTQLSMLDSTRAEVEGYWFTENNRRSLILINKSEGETEVELTGIPDKPAIEYVLNESTAAACRNLTATGEIPSLTPQPGVTATKIKMTAFEVRARIWE